MAEPLSLDAALGLSAGSSLVNQGLNWVFGESSQRKQIQAQKDLFDYQWNKAYSPRAQIRNLAGAGVNPVSQFGNGTMTVSGGQLGTVSPIDYQGIGTTDLTGLAQYIAATAEAKKKGVEIPGIEADTQGKILDNERKRFENELFKTYGSEKMAAEVSLAWQNYTLALQSEDLNEQELAKKRWEAAKEKALSQVAENQRDILKKELDNKDTEIKLRNEKGREEIKTEKSKQSSNYASANASNTQADVNRQLRRLNSALADVEEGSKTDKIQYLINEYRAQSAMSDLDYQEANRRIEAMQHMRDNELGREVDNFLEWLKGKVSIFGIAK